MGTRAHIDVCAVWTQILCGNYARANTLLDELVALADEKGALYWTALATLLRGGLLALTGKASEAVQTITSGINAQRSTGGTVQTPWSLSCLAMAHAELGKFDDAWRCIGEAMTAIEATKERVHEAEVNRFGGDIALMSELVPVV
jgi:ATP/maltotriose-dependent transcriptional regulator MalT